MLKSFVQSKSGNFAMMTAITLPVLVGVSGLGVDYAHLSSVRVKLQNAADTAVLVASREGTSASERDALFATYLTQNLNVDGVSVTESDIEVEEGLNFIEVRGTATASVNLFIMHRFGLGTVAVEAVATRSTQSVEIAMVLDNTGSMGADGINALKAASNALVDAVVAGKPEEQDIRIGVVPFVTAVNVKGTGYKAGWIDQEGLALYNGANFYSNKDQKDRADGKRDALAASERPHHLRLFDLVGVTWKGCVEARPAPYNFDLTAPSAANPDTLFVPYFAPDEPGNHRTDNGGNDGSALNNSWMNDVVSGNGAAAQSSLVKYTTPGTPKKIAETGPLTLGPNRACPTPITPLTSNFDTVRAAISAMKHWNGSGTNISEGLAWGWRVLSPEEPYDQGAAFNDQSVSKFMVLMTDGSNVSFGASSTFNKSDYGSYGFLGTGRIDGKTVQSQAEATLNTWTASMCTAMKNQGVEVFTVIYKETKASVQTLFRNCATRAENFHMTSNTTGLQAAFGNIGRRISALRLTH